MPSVEGHLARSGCPFFVSWLAANDSHAAVAAGRCQPSNSRSGHLAVVRPSTGWRHHRPLTWVLLTLPATAVAAGGPDPPTHVKPRHGQVERLLILGSTDHGRPRAGTRLKAQRTLNNVGSQG
jgi:hypothetical protein